ncbi:MAG: hypothetical protein LC772_02430 [Chloroflexi bacterium]|nr:hypothetical protein [Chloroflexota bacterium]
MKQVKVFVEDVAQGMGIDQAVNTWLESMADTVEVESIQVSMGAASSSTGDQAQGGRNWPVAVMVVYRAK